MMCSVNHKQLPEQNDLQKTHHDLHCPFPKGNEDIKNPLPPKALRRPTAAGAQVPLGSEHLTFINFAAFNGSLVWLSIMDFSAIG